MSCAEVHSRTYAVLYCAPDESEKDQASKGFINRDRFFCGDE